MQKNISIILILIFFSSCAPTLKDFTESKFSYFSSKPIYYYKIDKHELYYSNTGKMSNNNILLWKGEIDYRYTFPSPDHKYILFKTKNYKAYLIDNTGEIINEFSPFASWTDDEIYSKNKLNNFKIRWGSDVQWFKDSSGFITFYNELKTKKDNLPHSDYWNSNIIMYKIPKLKKTIALNAFESGDIFTSKNGNKILFQEAGSEKYSIFNIKKNQTRHVQNAITNYNKNEWFINKDYFTNIDNFFLTKKTQKNNQVISAVDSLYIINSNGTHTTLLEIKKEGCHPIFGTWTFNSQYNYFLPGNRFCTMYMSFSNLTGQIIIDTETKKIMKIENIHFIYNRNNENYWD